MSTTDPESGFLMREGKPKGFFYLDHRTVDVKYNIVTDTFITAGNVADSEPYLARLQKQIEKFQFNVEAIALDAGYFNNYICKKLAEQHIFTVMGYRRFGNAKKSLPKRKFHYIEEKDVYACPMGCILSYSTTDRDGYRHYKSKKSDCEVCPLRSDCMSAKQKQRTITRHIWEGYKEMTRQNFQSQLPHLVLFHQLSMNFSYTFTVSFLRIIYPRKFIIKIYYSLTFR